ncbi:DNA-binding SARP family transcriptional activator [Micromonospora vinacea]|uniref:DNA-binding SARP family transcriptional activator n=2 Tax=Micromonospora vinacea TaxID=709878 RepID=A0ABS0JWR0_9ACTN|nr:BTAD domain-containing putative transcriptional regulator [Micromonospora vinacea]MBG6100806.1 DNA-binding SARP family transcriptional activator [Micromonospora vinacea]
MSGELRFEVLGPQRAWHGDRDLDLGAGKQRAVLAVLLLSGGRPVTTTQIVDAVWPEEPPANGANVVQKYVAGLRRVLEPERTPRSPGQVLTLTDAGYQLRVGPDAVDAIRFERGIRRAERLRAEDRVAEAVTELKTTLELWKGEPFSGFAGPFFDSARQRWLELRATALESWADLELRLGGHGEMVGELRELTAEFPLRERLRHQLMLALHRSGRQAEALAEYRDFRGLLRDEYGIEPGDALQDLHRRVLRADPALLPPTAVSLPSTTVEPARPSSGPPAPARPPTAGPPAGLPTTVPARPDEPLTRGLPPPSTAEAAAVPPQAGPPPVSSPPLSTHAPEPSPAYGPPPNLSTLVTAPPPLDGAKRARMSPPRWASRVATIVGTALVLLSGGCLTWVVILAYAVWRRSWRLAIAGVGYLVLITIEVNLLNIEDPEAEVPGVTAFSFFGLALITWVVGAVHVILLSRGLWAAITGSQRTNADDRVDVERRVRREHARYLLYHYPAARGELSIGRPDLARSFDDGGLIDVNAVPEQVLATLPGLTEHQCRQIVVDRWMRGPYASMEEFAGRCLLPPNTTEPLRELLVFLPPTSVPVAEQPPPVGS